MGNIFAKQDYFTVGLEFQRVASSPYVTSHGEESKCYFSLKEKRKSLTPVIIVLSP